MRKRICATRAPPRQGRGSIARSQGEPTRRRTALGKQVTHSSRESTVDTHPRSDGRAAKCGKPASTSPAW